MKDDFNMKMLTLKNHLEMEEMKTREKENIAKWKFIISLDPTQVAECPSYILEQIDHKLSPIAKIGIL